MACCHAYDLVDGNENAFSVDTNALTFGHGALGEAGDVARALGMTRVALFTDVRLVDTPHVDKVQASLRSAGVDAVVYDEVRVEPTNTSFVRAAEFATEGRFDGFVSVGGGSVIDTAKAANLYATHPAPFEAYVNAPVGEGRAVPGPLKPHLACPTTSGTGSECTGIAVFDHLPLEAKTGIASRFLKPNRALVDPDTTRTLPATIVAASGFDVLCHALESFTARPFTARKKGARPMSQGANPWSDVGAREALRLTGAYLVRAVRDANDVQARAQMMWAATLAGIAFGNAGVHIPHGMAYAVAGLVRDYRPPDYDADEAMVPHGISVVVNAPATFASTAVTSPDRHREAARLLGGVASDDDDAGAALAARLGELMRDAAMPNGLGALGYATDDVPALTNGAIVQRRLLDNAPIEVTADTLAELFEAAMRIW